MAELTADQLVGIVNQLGLTEEQVAIAFAGAKASAQAKTLQAVVEQRTQENAALIAAEDEEMQPIFAARSQRANKIAAATALIGEIGSGRLLSDDEMKDALAALEF